ncbi:uncharacterized protein LOC142167018 [Nicotiana tabacum]|uniref:Uncharacterized protein LOC142167018 n=1 Tax=Nicotiana tabacum TaxID=4097 RepID=A0AC58SE68_TOBAC
MEFTREELYTVPIWIKLYGLDFKYWRPKGLSKIGSLIRKPLMVDQNTEKKLGLNFARLLVEVGMDTILPDCILFRNEKGSVVEQKVIYDWKPTLCKFCNKYGHSEAECRKKKGPKTDEQKEKTAQEGIRTDKPNSKDPKEKQQIQKSGEGQKELPLKEKIQEQANSVWITPSRGHAGRIQNKQTQQVTSSNTFQVLHRTKLDCSVTANVGDNVGGQPIPQSGNVLYPHNTIEERNELWENGGNPITWAEAVDFQHCVDTSGLIELPQQGQKYTWNDRSGDHRIFSKIDWMFINEVWLNTMPACRATFLPEGMSDHCPAKVMLNESNFRRRRDFYYSNVWAQHPLFLAKVKEVWDAQIDGCRMYQVVQKLKQLKRKLKELNKQQFSNIVKQAHTLLQLDPLNAQLQEDEKIKFQTFKQSSYLAEMFLQQKSKATWIKLGDDNTKYFFSVIKHRKLQQAITQMKDQYGNWKTKQEVIANIFVEYYTDLLGRKRSDRLQATTAFSTMGQPYQWNNKLI